MLGLKPRISIHQFFKYGYAEQKMMMCVEAIERSKSLAKEIKVSQTLTSSRKMTQRQSTSSGQRMMSQTKLKFKYNTLAEIQENMRLDFETQNQKKSKQYLNQKPKRSRKESLEASMRLTGNAAFLPKNRHRYPQ